MFEKDESKKVIARPITTGTPELWYYGDYNEKGKTLRIWMITTNSGSIGTVFPGPGTGSGWEPSDLYEVTGVGTDNWLISKAPEGIKTIADRWKENGYIQPEVMPISEKPSGLTNMSGVPISSKGNHSKIQLTRRKP